MHTSTMDLAMLYSFTVVSILAPTSSCCCPGAVLSPQKPYLFLLLYTQHCKQPILFSHQSLVATILHPSCPQLITLSSLFSLWSSVLMNNNFYYIHTTTTTTMHALTLIFLCCNMHQPRPSNCCTVTGEVYIDHPFFWAWCLLLTTVSLFCPPYSVS